VKLPQILLVVAVSVAITFAAVFTVAPWHGAGDASSSRESAFARVLRTNTLRCGYGIWAPGLTKDPATGQLGGIYYDFLEAIGAHTGLKIEWTEEVGWGDYPAALDSGRIDAMCFGAWPKASIARQVMFTKPTYYLPINAYARAGDTRFDRAIERADAPDVRISVMDGELSSELARTRFSHAQTVSVPQLSAAGTLLLNVATGKADITFTDAWTAAAYMAQNPGTLRLVPLDRPLRLFGHTIPVAQDEPALVSLLNTATDEIVNDGEFALIMRKYDPTGILYMPAGLSNEKAR
jgi:ABC-type amino acid transport substrate-binding protein